MGKMETSLDYRAQFVNGQLDRMAGQAIQTRDQHAASLPGVGYEDLQDLYRSYRNGYNSH